jgi:uracil phosphoribosyltransferase
MLATGQSIVAVYNKLMERGMPKEIHIVVIAAPEGIAISNSTYRNTAIFGSFLDDKLNEHSYIVPGLGDAGDLAYGQNYN